MIKICRSILCALAVFCVLAIVSTVHAATPTCVTGKAGTAPTASISFTPPATFNGAESAPSNEVCKAFPQPPPGTVTITIS